jgi:predicted aspartyl protease
MSAQRQACRRANRTPATTLNSALVPLSSDERLEVEIFTTQVFFGEVRSPRVGVSLKKEGGAFVVPVQINGAITLDFTVDSGAADVSVPADVFSTLARTGTIRDSDIIGEQTYVLADGSKSQSSHVHNQVAKGWRQSC